MGTEQVSAHKYREPLDPLYQFLYTNGELERKKLHSGGKTNAGLWLDKYIKNQSQDDTSSRSDLVREVAEIAIPATYEQFYGRWKQTLVVRRRHSSNCRGRESTRSLRESGLLSS